MILKQAHAASSQTNCGRWLTIVAGIPTEYAGGPPRLRRLRRLTIETTGRVLALPLRRAVAGGVLRAFMGRHSDAQHRKVCVSPHAAMPSKRQTIVRAPAWILSDCRTDIHSAV